MSDHAGPLFRRPRRHRKSLSVTWSTSATFLAPFYLLFALLFVLPILFAVYQSLFGVQRTGGVFGTAQQVFVGGAQYVRVFSDPEFQSGVVRVVLFACLQVPTMVVIAVGLALLLDAVRSRSRKIFRTIYFIPYAISTVIAALMWGNLYSPGTSVLSEFGIGVDLLAPQYIIPALANIGIWSFGGFNVLIMTTALTAISPSVIEAASIDGANRMAIALRIKLPLIAPTIVMVGVLSIIGTLQLFTEPQVLSVDSNAISSTFTPNMLAYTALSGNDYSYAAAVSVALAVVGFVFSFAFLRIARRVSA